jgi:hypothetical protein
MSKKEMKRSAGPVTGYLTCEKEGGGGGGETRQILNFKTSTHPKNFTHIQRGPVHFMPNDIIIFACIRNRTSHTFLTWYEMFWSFVIKI